MESTRLDRERYHWYQNAQNLFWKSPIWDIKTRFDHDFNLALLDEIYEIGRDITTGVDRTPQRSIWDYDKPALKQLNHEIIEIVTRAITQKIPEVRQLNIAGCEHFMGWINVREPGEALEVHGHTESAIAATYYLQASPGCGDLICFDTSRTINWESGYLNPIGKVVERRFKPVEGHLIFFPSYVLHGVEPNNSNDLRISLSTDLRKVVNPDANDTVILKSWAGRMAKIKEWNVPKT